MPTLPTTRQIDAQVETLCRHHLLDGPLRGSLLRYLVRIHRKGIFENGRRKTGKTLLFEFYRETVVLRNGITEDDMESDGKHLLADLAGALDQYYEEVPAGSPDAVVISISRGRGRSYQPVYGFQRESSARPPASKPVAAARVLPAETAAAEPLTRRLWAAYLDHDIPTHIAYGVPLFTSSSDKLTYTWRVNESDPEAVEKKYPGERASWAFVTLGDVLCTFQLMGWLANRGVSLTTNAYNAQSELKDVRAIAGRRANVIAVGSTRLNGVLADYQQQELDPPIRGYHLLPYHLGLHHVDCYDAAG